MPMLFLSPSTQEYNIYYDGSGSEEYYTNLIADYMEPYLTASGITFTRNNPEGSVGDSVRLSNAGDYALHLAIHSNASGSANYGRQTGSDVYYYPTSVNGKRAAVLISENLSTIYPFPEGARAEPTTSLGEVTRTRAPAVLVEIAYHDNVDDANWITSNLEKIAEKLALSMTEYFGLPLVPPMIPQTGKVALTSGNLNIRNYPSIGGKIISSAPNGAMLTVLGSKNGWFTVNYNGNVGFANSDYIRLI